MRFRDLHLAGLVEIEPETISDRRGHFSEIFRLDEFSKHVSTSQFVQENESLSLGAGTIRGIHFQTPPAVQGKLVRCTAGKLFDVAVDLRHDSATFRKWTSAILSPKSNNQLWIPSGFGHAFCTLEPNSVVSYRVTSYYNRDCDKGVAWDDPEIDIDWPTIADPSTLSAKDRVQPALAELPRYFSVKDC